MNNIMVDLETMGQGADAAIASIGAVKFSASGLGEEFYVDVELESCLVYGMKLSTDTLLWWLKQSDGARKHLHSPAKPPLRLPAALAQFQTFLGPQQDKVKIWGNGADFDNAILQYAYRATNMDLPWKFWNNRCYRTMKGMFPGVKQQTREGTYHNALDDAKHQATHLVAILNSITRVGGKGA